MSKTIQDYMDKHPDKFEEWYTEDNNDRGCDYWVHCREPYFYPSTETSTIHEDTVKETLYAMRHVVKGFHNGYAWQEFPKEK